MTYWLEIGSKNKTNLFNGDCRKSLKRVDQ